jgi:ribosomal protein S18 acetylase RimI-like enzyme
MAETGSSPNKLIVRPIGAGDRGRVIALWSEVFPDDPVWNAPGAVIDRKLAYQPELLLVGELESRVVATLLAGYDGFRGWIYHLATAPGLRRQGIATTLMREAERRLLGFGCVKVNLQVRASNAGLVEFYRRRGYRIEDRTSLGKRLSDE